LFGRSLDFLFWRERGLRGKPFFHFGLEIRVLGLEVLEKGGGFGGAVVLEEKLVVVDEGVDVAGVDLKAGFIGLFGGGGVTLMSEKIRVSDGHVGIIFARFV
jgi:hypothetical protein